MPANADVTEADLAHGAPGTHLQHRLPVPRDGDIISIGSARTLAAVAGPQIGDHEAAGTSPSDDSREHRGRVHPLGLGDKQRHTSAGGGRRPRSGTTCAARLRVSRSSAWSSRWSRSRPSAPRLASGLVPAPQSCPPAAFRRPYLLECLALRRRQIARRRPARGERHTANSALPRPRDLTRNTPIPSLADTASAAVP